MARWPGHKNCCPRPELRRRPAIFSDLQLTRKFPARFPPPEAGKGAQREGIIPVVCFPGSTTGWGLF